MCSPENWALCLAWSNLILFPFFCCVGADIHFPLKYLECVENFRMWRSWPFLLQRLACLALVQTSLGFMLDRAGTEAHTSHPSGPFWRGQPCERGRGLLQRCQNEMRPAQIAAGKFSMVTASAVNEGIPHSNKAWQDYDTLHQKNSSIHCSSTYVSPYVRCAASRVHLFFYWLSCLF